MVPEGLTFGGTRSPCREHDCRLCCFDTQMPLLPSDITRLAEATGRAPESFHHDDHGTPRLRNIDGHCVFLGPDGCTVYAHRPAGCRLYPLVWDPDAATEVLDPECPHTRAFRVRPKDRAALRDLVAALEADP